MEPKLFEALNQSRSRNYCINKYLLQSVWRMLVLLCYRTVLSDSIWLELELELEAGAEIRDKGGAGVGAENK